jgi:oligosaccharide repeat unit polymerase
MHKRHHYFWAVAIMVILLASFTQIWFSIVLVVVTYAILLLIAHRLYDLMNWIDPTVMFIVSYVTFVGLGLIVGQYFEIKFLSSVIFGVIAGLIAFLVGAIVADMTNSSRRHIKVKKALNLNVTSNWREVVWAWAFFFIGVLLFLFFYFAAGGVPIFAEDAESVRLTAKAGRGYLLIGGFAFLIVSTSILAAVYSQKKSLSSPLIVSFIIFVAILLTLGVGYRVHAVRIILNAFIIYSFVRFSRIPGIKFSLLIAFIIVFLGLIGFYRFSGQFVSSYTQLEFAFSRILWSIFVRYLHIFNLTVPVFPEHEPFLLGRGYLMSLATIIPGEQAHFGFWLRDRLGLVLATPGPVDPTILGEFYVNFGWIGTVVGMCLMGFGIRTLYLRLTKVPYLSLRRLALMTLISTSLIGMTGSGIILVLLFDAIPLVFVFLAYDFCVRSKISLPENIHAKQEVSPLA